MDDRSGENVKAKLDVASRATWRSGRRPGKLFLQKPVIKKRSHDLPRQPARVENQPVPASL